MSHENTRTVLWGRKTAEEVHAQVLDAEADQLEEAARKARALSAACRYRARHFKIAAEIIAGQALPEETQD